ncbi:MAG: glycoside hydrolase [Acidobacteriia bacterium]|nr:glycoside hydrolase [Terriglobia bacterium]
MLFAALALSLHLSPVLPPAPNRQPQLAAGKAITALVFGSGESIWFSRSSDQGATWSPPSKIADLPKLLLGRHRGPRVVVSGETLLVSAAPAGGDLLCWRSTDAGRTWSKPAAINDQPTSAREGLQAMAADAQGRVAAAWLDDRAPGGKRLYGAFSSDAGATWSKNTLLYESPSGSICQCCHPSLVALGRGEFAVMWRNVIEGSRDLYTLRIRDRKPVSAAMKLGTGTWKLDACPMDGGGLALDRGRIVSAWRREHDIYLSAAGKPEIHIGEGQDVALAAGAGGPYAIWRSAQGIVARLPGSAAVTTLSRTGASPAVAAWPDGAVLAAWEENGSIAIRRLDRSGRGN